MFSLECRKWTRPVLKSSLLKYLRQEAPSPGLHGSPISTSVKEIHGGWIDLLRKWRSDMAIAKLLMNALEKTLSLVGFGAVLANELAQGERDEKSILQYLQGVFYEETADCELKLSILRLFSRVLALGEATSEDDYQIWRIVFLQMLLSVLASNGDMESVAGICFRLVNQTVMHHDGQSQEMLLADKAQNVMLNVCEKHAESSKAVFSLISRIPDVMTCS